MSYELPWESGRELALGVGNSKLRKKRKIWEPLFTKSYEPHWARPHRKKFFGEL